ncbi:MAG: hypothetical protein HUJ26_02815 [Planctomycetaceae bacterium]|nr:hypothetical protein [Planctomycetaceae bacterium]
MTGDRFETAPLLDVWVERTLDLKDETDEKTRQQTLLRRLEDVQFHPGFYEASALQGYLNQDLSSIAKWHACERLLREDLVRFREEFFDLNIEERKARYRKLYQDAEHFPVLNQLLSQLRPVLDHTDNSLEQLSPEAESLAYFLRGQICEEPHRRAAIRREYEQSHNYEPPQWKRIVRELRERVPELLAIDPRWVRRLENPPKTTNKLVKLGSASGQNDSSGGNSGWVIALVVFFVIRGISVISRYDHSTDTAQYTRPPTIERPTDFDPEQMREILESLQVQPPHSSPPVFDQEPLEEQQQQEQVDSLAKLKDDEFARHGFTQFKIVKQSGLLYIVFDKEQYLGEMTALSKHPNREQTRLYTMRQSEFSEFQTAMDLVQLFQPEVYVTYDGMELQKKRPVPKGTILRPLIPNEPLTDQALKPPPLLETDSPPPDRAENPSSGETLNE